MRVLLSAAGLSSCCCHFENAFLITFFLGVLLAGFLPAFFFPTALNLPFKLTAFPLASFPDDLMGVVMGTRQGCLLTGMLSRGRLSQPLETGCSP